MLIPPRMIYKYLSSMEFPVVVYPETGDDPAFEVTLEGLRELIEAGAVVAYGSWKRIRKLRLIRPTNKMVRLRLKLRHSLISDCNRTVVQETVDDQGHQAWKFLAGRALSYLGRVPRKGELDGSAL